MYSIKELENWMLINNIKNTFTPNFRYTTDFGEGLDNLNGLYVWYSIDEKGNRTDIEFFSKEEKAVQYIQEYLIALFKILK